jgi:hypothetical protein
MMPGVRYQGRLRGRQTDDTDLTDAGPGQHKLSKQRGTAVAGMSGSPAHDSSQTPGAYHYDRRRAATDV